MAATPAFEERHALVAVPASGEAVEAPRLHLLVVALATLGIAAVATWWSMAAGVSHAYSDSTHHLVIARRVVDSGTPGFAQLGTVWLPLPHLVLLPLTLVDPLFWSGLAGAVLNGASLVAAAVGVFLVAWSGTGRVAAGYVAAGVLVTDPNLLYLQSSAMTEPLYIAVLVLQAYAMMRWVREQRVGDLLALGIVTAIGVGTRYDGWFVAAAITFSVVAITIVRFRDQERATANGITVVAVSAFVVFLWLFYNWIIFGNPLEFSNGELAPATQAEAIGIDATKGDLVGSIYTYGTAMLEDLGPVLLVFGAIAVAWSAVREARTPALWALVVLGSAAGFNVVSLFLGQSVIRTQYTDPEGALNIRYGIQALPVVAMASGLWVGNLGNSFRRRAGIAVVVLVVAAQSALYVAGGREAVRTLVDSQPERPAIAEAGEAAVWYRERRQDGELALFYTLATPESGRFFMRAQVPMREFVTENNAAAWRAALAHPLDHVDWLVVSPRLPGRVDPVREIVETSQHIGLDARFDLQGTVDGWEFYRRTPARAE